VKRDSAMLSEFSMLNNFADLDVLVVGSELLLPHVFIFVSTLWRCLRRAR
jgi:hypothetical protein